VRTSTARSRGPMTPPDGTAAQARAIVGAYYGAHKPLCDAALCRTCQVAKACAGAVATALRVRTAERDEAFKNWQTQANLQIPLQQERDRLAERVKAVEEALNRALFRFDASETFLADGREWHPGRIAPVTLAELRALQAGARGDKG